MKIKKLFLVLVLITVLNSVSYSYDKMYYIVKQNDTCWMVSEYSVSVYFTRENNINTITWFDSTVSAEITVCGNFVIYYVEKGRTDLKAVFKQLNVRKQDIIMVK